MRSIVGTRKSPFSSPFKMPDSSPFFRSPSVVEYIPDYLLLTSDPSFLDRFEKSYVPEPNSGCWLWTASCNWLGYGYITFNHKIKSAHRLSYELYKGKIPAGLNVLHKCDSAFCINPEHLFLGTQKENIMDAVRKGHWQRHGKYANRAHITPTQVISIRHDKRVCRAIAKDYGVSHVAISLIKNRKRQAWVKDPLEVS